MGDEKRQTEKNNGMVSPGEFITLLILLMVLAGVVISVIQERIDREIDPQKEVYLFLHGREDLMEKAESALVAYGFLREKIVRASSEAIGKKGDYMAMLWRPPRPDHIKIQKITGVKEVEPDKVFGQWKGVMKKDLGTVPLE